MPLLAEGAFMYNVLDYLYEAEASYTKKCQIPVSYDILNQLQIVMAQAKVVKLYQNEGNGEVLIIATALAMKNLENSKLFKDEWVIVTCDKGLSLGGQQ